MDVERDVLRVAELLAEGKTRSEIIAEFERKRKASPRRVEEYIRQARRQWRDDHADALPTILESELVRLRAAREFCRKREAYAQMARYDDMIIRVLGLTQPERHLHLHAQPAATAAQPPAIVHYPGMPDHMLDALEAALRSAIAQGVPQLPPAAENAQEGPASANGEGSDAG